MTVPETKTSNLHSPTFPELSEAKYRILCLPAKNISLDFFPMWVMLGVKPELSVAIGWGHITLVDVVPLSAIATISFEQLEKTGLVTSENEEVTL